MDDYSALESRKADHIRINLEEDVQSSISTGLEKYSFIHSALPELDMASVDLSTTFLGKRLSAPLLISSMTGGTPQAGLINRILAEVAQSTGIAMGLGSQRVSLTNPEVLSSFKVRAVAPDILLFANIGAIQLNNGVGVNECRRMIEDVDADGLILHLNPLQEALQVDGDTNFAGLMPKITEICIKLGKPVIVKEVGWGISSGVARTLMDAGVSAIDVAGSGGTSWSLVEKARLTDPVKQHVAELFRGWGIPTADAIRQIRSAQPGMPLIGSGGLRTGLDAAKCIALGADVCGFAGPFLKAAALGPENVDSLVKEIMLALKTVMFVVNAVNIEALKKTPLLGPSE